MQHDAHDAADARDRRARALARARGGRHRHGPGRPGPSFRTAAMATGTLAAALTVATGLYATAPGAPSGRGGPSAAPSLARAEPVTAARAAARPATLPEQAAGTDGQYVTQVVLLANAERKKAGCAPLRSDARLQEAAQGHADDMAARASYAHVGKDGRDAGDRMAAAGYTWTSWGENIHRGPESPAQAVEDWMNSPGHRKNILNCAFEDIGVGVNLRANGPWWVQDFATGR
ncbi:CAP domain-containing protein [Streptomyces sp. NPDC056632]|uniref:CAP domain-containing protein n=1 Tax=Streptomyces sp. NPDC056632 TaxID=3345884 RepID=UPI0036CAD572